MLNERLAFFQKPVTGILSSEEVLDDDVELYGCYFYIAKTTTDEFFLFENNWHGLTVKNAKRNFKLENIFSCDIYGRREKGAI